MKHEKPVPWALPYLLIVLLVAPSTYAQEPMYRYELRVDGMVCAYCAYNVSQRLGQLEGVTAGSVDVDLEAKRVRFHAQCKLSKPMIEEVLTDSGFTVKAIEQKMFDGDDEEAAMGTQRAQINIPLAALNSELSSELLETLLAAAAAPKGRLVIRAPAALETTLLKPLLAGRRPAIPVDFQATESDTVSVTLWTRQQRAGTDKRSNP